MTSVAAPKTTASAAPTLTPGRYRLDPTRSVIRVRTRHRFGLFPVRATFRALAGGVTVVDRRTRFGVSAMRGMAAKYLTFEFAHDHSVWEP